MATNLREPGFGHVLGHFDTTVVVAFLDAEQVAQWLPPGLSLAARGPGREGSHPVMCMVAKGYQVALSFLPMAMMRANVVGIFVPGVTMDGREDLGIFSHTIRWWCDRGWRPRLGARWMGLPSGPEAPIFSAPTSSWTAEVPGFCKISVQENGRFPDWPQARALCPVIQQPLLAERGGKWLASGLYWNLGDADMRDATVQLELSPAVSQRPGFAGMAVDTRIEGLVDTGTGGALRLASDWTMTRRRTVDAGWSNWRARPSMRLRADTALIDVAAPKPSAPPPTA